MPKPKLNELKIWWTPCSGSGALFERKVKNLKEAKILLIMLSEYDIFLEKHKFLPDYDANSGGLEVWGMNDADAADGSWYEWEDEEGRDIWEIIDGDIIDRE